MLEILKTLFIITIKRALRVRLTMILGIIFSIYNTLSFKYYKWCKYFLKSLSNTLCLTVILRNVSNLYNTSKILSFKY